MTTTNLRTVGEIAAQSLTAVRVLESCGIDYCCGGNRSLEEACGQLRINPTDVRAKLEAADENPSVENRNWQQESLTQLAQHIVSTHHEYLKQEFPLLSGRLDAVRKAHAEKHGATLEKLAVVYQAMRDELVMHMRKEEMILFPFVELMDRAATNGSTAPVPPFGSVGNPIGMMEHEHEDAGKALAEIRRLTNNFVPPPDACITYRALYAGLQALEQDLHLHIHLENNILFPRAIALESMGN